jgi:hypothetical protein
VGAGGVSRYRDAALGVGRTGRAADFVPKTVSPSPPDVERFYRSLTPPNRFGSSRLAERLVDKEREEKQTEKIEKTHWVAALVALAAGAHAPL